MYFGDRYFQILSRGWGSVRLKDILGQISRRTCDKQDWNPRFNYNFSRQKKRILNSGFSTKSSKVAQAGRIRCFAALANASACVVVHKTSDSSPPKEPVIDRARGECAKNGAGTPNRMSRREI
jgi:hypothetical protein